MHSLLGFAAAVSAYVHLHQQFRTNFHRTCEAQILGNSLNVAYLSVYTAVGTSNRH